MNSTLTVISLSTLKLLSQGFLITCLGIPHFSLVALKIFIFIFEVLLFHNTVGWYLLFLLCTHVTSSFEDLDLTLIPEHF